MAKKRGQGEGSIYKRKDGLWVTQVTIQGKRISKYFKTQGECREWLRNTQNQIQNGLTLSGAKTNLREFLDQWLGAIRESVRPKTFWQYRQLVQQHISPVLGDVKLKDLRPDQIQGLYNLKLDSGLSPRMVVLVHAVLHRSLNQAVKWGLIGRNPADAVSRPKVKKKEMKTLNDDQVRAFLSVAKEDRYEVLFWLAVFTGMRQGELLGLQWSDIEWNKKRIQVQRQLQRLPGQGLVFTEPKSAAGRRTIMLSTATIEKLREQLSILQRERQIAGEKWHENDLVFPSVSGQPLDQQTLDRNFKRTLRKAGLPSIRFHDLRHTAATLMLLQGIHPKVVQERLGHSDITLTLNTYSHVLPSMQEDAAEKMDELLTPIDVSQSLKELGESKHEYRVFSNSEK
jgi:integrase